VAIDRVTDAAGNAIGRYPLAYVPGRQLCGRSLIPAQAVRFLTGIDRVMH
jgi:hypothetical protein